VRFVGHGIGLELVEPPLVAAHRGDVLRPGMILALEPKMVFPGRFSAGVESVVEVTETGARRVSEVPAEVFIC
jgi:Xaa-Pro aminopeptidase